MTTTVGNSNASSAANPFAQFNAKAAASTTDTVTEDRFLKLLTAQMKNQDPLNPLDNAQVTSQLAQISTVNGIEKLDRTLKSVLSGNEEMQAMQATTLVGRDVMAQGDALTLADGAAIGGFDLPAGAESVTVTIKSEGGQVAHRQTLKLPAGMAAWPAGAHTFTWDGKTDAGADAKAGNYVFKVEAANGAKPAEAQTLAISRVDGVNPGAAGFTINTSRGMIDFANVKRVM